MTVLAVDVGAETVDLAFLAAGEVRSAKLKRAGTSPASDVLAAIVAVAKDWQFDPGALGEIRVGSTGLVNMLLGRDLPKVGLITTAGFSDTLALARQNREALYDPVARSPAPTFLVAPGCIAQVEGRIDFEGAEITPLSRQNVRDAARKMLAQGVEAIAVCLIFAHVDPAHEKACAGIIAEIAPGIPVAMSHEVDPRAREYERTVSTCLAACTRPAQQAFVAELEQGLDALAFEGRLSFADSRGHLIGAREAGRDVIGQLLGGPAGSSLYSGALARADGASRAIAIDIGSTSSDITAIEAGSVRTAMTGAIASVPVRTEMADVESIAMGGATTADRLIGGLTASLSVMPTLTDALVVLDELPADLAPQAADTLAACAQDMGIFAHELALRMRDAALDAISSALVRHAVSRNMDPAKMKLIASGGLGPVLAGALAERIGAPASLIGRHAAVSGAVGLLHARHVVEARTDVNLPLGSLDDDRVQSIEARLAASDPQAGDGIVAISYAPTALMHPVRVTLPGAELSLRAIRSAIEAHEAGIGGAVALGPGFVFSIARQRFEDALDVPCETNPSTPCDHGAPTEAPRPETVQLRLNAIAQSMQDVLFRSAVSPVVREGNDAAAALLTLDGELIALSDAIPLLLGALDGSARAILDRFPVAGMREGDLFVMNDPYLGGTHLPDLTVLRPLFFEGRPIALAASILHHQDVGGMRPGSVPPDATDIFQEGLRLAPTLMGENDTIGRTFVDIIRANSRAPDIVLGDLSAQVRAAVQAGDRLGSLAGEIGADALADAMRDCLDRAQALAQRAIGAMQAGPHQATDRLDPLPGLPEISIALALDTSGGKLTLDFACTSPQVAGPVNCVRSGPFAAAFYSLLSAMDDTMFRNGGIVRAIDLRLPEGCAINASPPAAVNARMGIVRATTSVILQSLAKALPGRMPAANSGMSYVLAFSGTRADGRHFIATEIIAGGAGAGPSRDGASGISTDVGNAMNMPVEALEAQIPVRVLRAEIRPASGGEGRFRGGDGIARHYLALQDGISVSVRGERFHHVPQGHDGGAPPQPAAARVIRADGSVEHLKSKSTPTLARGDVLVIESCGGAGYGRA